MHKAIIPSVAPQSAVDVVKRPTKEEEAAEINLQLKLQEQKQREDAENAALEKKRLENKKFLDEALHRMSDSTSVAPHRRKSKNDLLSYAHFIVS